MNTIVAGVDLGGTGSRFVLCRGDNVIASRTVSTGIFADLGSPSERLDCFVATLGALLPPGEVLAAIGIGASGPVDVASGVVHNPDTLEAFSGFPLVRGVAERTGIPVAIDNDAVTAAVAEHRFGAGTGARRMLMVTLGTGIGAALLVDGSPFRGASGAHPEAGHIPINGLSGRCYCGVEGCWEFVASRAAFQRLLRPVMPADISDRNLIDEASAHATDESILNVFRHYGRLVGQGLSVLHTLYMPDVTVIGGSAATAFPLFQPSLQQALIRAPSFSVPTEIREAGLGDMAGALGAAGLALDMVRR